MDESGFSLQPSVPYAWQKRGQRLSIGCKRDKRRLNVLGVLGLNGRLFAYYNTKPIDSAFVEASLADFFTQSPSAKPVVVILDNAPIHHSKSFKERFGKYEQQDCYVFYLPRYSPHLNLIEHLWHRMKYQWLLKSDYASWKKLKQKITEILSNFGQDYQLSFHKFVNNKIKHNFA
jgi:transposase